MYVNLKAARVALSVLCIHSVDHLKILLPGLMLDLGLLK